MMRFLSKLKKLPGPVCLLRVDFNVEGTEDSLRLEASLPTIKFLLKKKAKIVILSHRGRPKNREENLSLREFAPFLEKELKQQIIFLETIPNKLPGESVFLLENLRFFPEEEKNDSGFAKKLAKLGDFYVNDAFAVCHRENSSVTQLPKLLPSYAGFLLEKEIETLSRVMKNPEKPMVLIFGGAKMDDKLPIIKNLLPKTDSVLLGSSALHNLEVLPKSSKIKKPIDWISENDLAFDIGPGAVEEYSKEMKKAKTIIWNGPVGKFEDKKYRKGSEAIAKAIVKSRAFSVVGGGETTQLFISAITNYKLLIARKKLFLSTGGGAMLEFLAGKELPGIEALK